MNLQYEDIFGSNVKKQVNVMQIFYERFEIRKSYLPPQHRGVRAPVDPSRVPGLRQVQQLGIKEAKQKNKFNKKQNKGSQQKTLQH